MNLFAQYLSKNNKQIKESRVARIGKQAEMAQNDLANTLEKEMMSLEAQLDDLEDMSPDTAMSLNPIKGDFNADEWVKRLQNIKVEMLNKKIELQVATETYDKYFKAED